MRQKKLTKRKFKRVYHHYLKCEEYDGPMWKTLDVEARAEAVQASADLMIDSKRFKAACLRVIAEWPNSCESNLTASVINHQAWIGAAACALNHGASEDMTRLGWRTLSQEQQDAANTVADQAIHEWGESYARRAVVA
jgi:hypothetical protein